MEIVLERIAKKNTYTIGRLYLLADGDEAQRCFPASLPATSAVSNILST